MSDPLQSSGYESQISELQAIQNANNIRLAEGYMTVQPAGAKQLSNQQASNFQQQNAMASKAIAAFQSQSPNALQFYLQAKYPGMSGTVAREQAGLTLYHKSASELAAEQQALDARYMDETHQVLAPVPIAGQFLQPTIPVITLTNELTGEVYRTTSVTPNYTDLSMTTEVPSLLSQKMSEMMTENAQSQSGLQAQATFDLAQNLKAEGVGVNDITGASLNGGGLTISYVAPAEPTLPAVMTSTGLVSTATPLTFQEAPVIPYDIPSGQPLIISQEAGDRIATQALASGNITIQPAGTEQYDFGNLNIPPSGSGATLEAPRDTEMADWLAKSSFEKFRETPTGMAVGEFVSGIVELPKNVNEGLQNDPFGALVSAAPFVAGGLLAGPLGIGVVGGLGVGVVGNQAIAVGMGEQPPLLEHPMQYLGGLTGGVIIGEAIGIGGTELAKQSFKTQAEVQLSKGSLAGEIVDLPFGGVGEKLSNQVVKVGGRTFDVETQMGGADGLGGFEFGYSKSSAVAQFPVLSSAGQELAVSVGERFYDLDVQNAPLTSALIPYQTTVTQRVPDSTASMIAQEPVMKDVPIGSIQNVASIGSVSNEQVTIFGSVTPATEMKLETGKTIPIPANKELGWLRQTSEAVDLATPEFSKNTIEGMSFSIASEIVPDSTASMIAQEPVIKEVLSNPRISEIRIDSYNQPATKEFPIQMGRGEDIFQGVDIIGGSVEGVRSSFVTTTNVMGVRPTSGGEVVGSMAREQLPSPPSAEALEINRIMREKYVDDDAGLRSGYLFGMDAATVATMFEAKGLTGRNALDPIAWESETSSSSKSSSESVIFGMVGGRGVFENMAGQGRSPSPGTSVMLGIGGGDVSALSSGIGQQAASGLHLAVVGDVVLGVSASNFRSEIETVPKTVSPTTVSGLKSSLLTSPMVMTESKNDVAIETIQKSDVALRLGQSSLLDQSQLLDMSLKSDQSLKMDQVLDLKLDTTTQMGGRFGFEIPPPGLPGGGLDLLFSKTKRRKIVNQKLPKGKRVFGYTATLIPADRGIFGPKSGLAVKTGLLPRVLSRKMKPLRL